MNREQSDLLSPATDLISIQQLLAYMHDDLHGKVARVRQLADVTTALGMNGTMMAGDILPKRHEPSFV